LNGAHPIARPRHFVAAVTTLSVLSGLFLVGTFSYLSLYLTTATLPQLARTLVETVLSQLSLQGENVLAAWFSSMLLLLASAAALWSFALDRQIDRGRNVLSLGWLILAAIFLLLSLDELGSLHERLGALRTSAPPGSVERAPRGWVVLLALPIAVTAAFMTTFAWFRLRRCVPAFLLMVAGVLLFLTIPAQEVLEISLFSINGESRRPPALSVLEEGTELAGTICFIIAFVLYATRAMTSLPLRNRPSVALPKAVWRRCLVAYVLVMSIGLAASLVSAQTRQPSSPDALWAASSFNGALTSLDVDLALALASNDFELRILPSQPGSQSVYVGKSSLRGWLQQSRALDLRIHQTSLTPDGDKFVWLGRATQQDWSQQGIGTLRTETTMQVRDGKVASLTLHVGAPPNEVLGNASNWFPSAGAAIVATLAALGLETTRSARPPVRAGLAALTFASLALSAYVGSNGPAYLTGDAGLLPRLIAECVRGTLVLAAVLLGFGRSSTAEIAALVGGAVIAGLGLGLSGVFTPIAAVLGMTLIGGVVSRIALNIEPAVLTTATWSSHSPRLSPLHAEASSANR